MNIIDFGSVVHPLLHSESECGDIGFVKDLKNKSLIVLIDVLGHGKGAREVALIAKEYIEKDPYESLENIMKGLHLILAGTRGAVIFAGHLNNSTGELKYVGTGNISIRVFGHKPKKLILKDGIVGYIMSAPKEKSHMLSKGDVLVIHTDGIREHFSSYECEDILIQSAQEIADCIMERFEKKTDDAMCIVLKYN